MLESPDMHPRDRAGFQLYLASNSPRRRELLTLLGREFTRLAAQVDETPLPDEDGAEYVRRIANAKALAAAKQPNVRGLIITADTAVVDGYGRDRAEILGKPRDFKDAAVMLRALRGHAHQVFTAITVLATQSGTILADLCKTDVLMRNYTDQEIDAYVATGDPMDKAGAYAIQHAGFHPVDNLDGCFANVMGLPMCHLVRNMAHLGMVLAVDAPRACQTALGYDCPVFATILNETALAKA